ncbi:hypothetical protein C9F11_18135 [Streptomyces sp. YIM 121038]|uniref:hypothetical protein n=1 Tax=Streptomyces sp. YIM 121038 TaxID=2136401 RepID=UPI001110EBE5|nr:hypothetical protein [Streptomyces sp. YIM 121038]QCX77279.1 hypothetical protein C9F11_18135 [Streptomyces sp. YIM 121038]
MHLLCVDWDFFFPTPTAGAALSEHSRLYAWPIAEDVHHVEVIWLQRIRRFHEAGVQLPRCHGYEGFWNRFTIAPAAPVWYADSNAWAAQVFPSDIGGEGSWASVHLYDAHHDCGYRRNTATFEEWKQRGRISAEDWMLAHHWAGSRLFVHFPPWRESMARPTEEPVIPVNMNIDDGEAPTVTFDAVFVCRSGAWVPSWCDRQFTEFIEACPARPVEHPRNVWRHPRHDVERMERLSRRTGRFRH